MPTYDYQCQVCKKRFNRFMSYKEYESAKVTCPFCSSDQVKRVIGRIRVTRGDAGRLADLSDPAALDRLDDDPKTLGRMMREMKSSVGADLGGEFDDVVDRLESGQTPDQIDQSFPDVPGD